MPKKPGSFSYGVKRGCHFYWEGGEYIDVSIEGQAIAVINVWDHANNRPSISTTQIEFVAACEKWLKETTAEEMRQYTLVARSQKRTQ